MSNGYGAGVEHVRMAALRLAMPPILLGYTGWKPVPHKKCHPMALLKEQWHTSA